MSDLTLLGLLQFGSALLGILVGLWLVGGWINQFCTWIDRHMAGFSRRRELERLRAMQEGRRQMAQMFDPKARQ